MKKEKIIMGMTIKIEIADKIFDDLIFLKVFSFFEEVDNKFSTYKSDSEISKINNGLLKKENASSEMSQIFLLAEKTKIDTGGYFDILTPEKKLDPSGIVKGWAILEASKILENNGYKNFYIDAGGDIEVRGTQNGRPWKIGIRNPLKPEEVVKVLNIENMGVATSGNYVRGAHIYNPKKEDMPKKLASLTVIGPNIYEADRYATAAFAMGEKGVYFIENLPGFEGYSINIDGIATMTRGFENLC